MKLNAARALTGAIVIATPVFLLRPIYHLPTHALFGRVLSFLQEDHWTRHRQGKAIQSSGRHCKPVFSNQELSD
jgi:hypothetical protein